MDGLGWRPASMLDSLRNRAFRWLWLGQLAMAVTFQMSTVAQGWLVYELTGSAFALGWVGAGWSVSALILSPYAGVISDRVEKRNLAVGMQLAIALNGAVLATLVVLGSVRIWHLAASSLVSGVLFSFMMPAEVAMVAELVDRRTLLNANAIVSIGTGLTGILGPSVAGLVIAAAGAGGVYGLVAGINLLAVLALIRLPCTGRADASAAPIWTDLKEGLKYVGRTRVLVTLLGLLFVLVVFSMPYQTFMPKFAKEVMRFDAKGLGLLLAAPGAGSLASSLGIVMLGDYRNKGKLLLAAGGLCGIALMAFVCSPWLATMLLLLCLVGAASNACMVTNETLLQAQCEDRYRGRVMSMVLIMWSLMPLATIPAGLLVDRIGVAPVVALQGGLLAAVFLAAWVAKPHLRHLG